MAAVRALDAGNKTLAHSTAVVPRGPAAEALASPVRRRILEALSEPGSATTVAAALETPRQLVNYHLRVLEKAGLVEPVGTRQKRGLTERLVRATATHYLVSPQSVGAAPQAPDVLSSTFQVAVAARTIREVAALAELARQAGKTLTTMTLDTEISFGSPADREAFGNEFSKAIQKLVAKYGNRPGRNRRVYRLFAGAHPVYHPPAPKGTSR